MAVILSFLIAIVIGMSDFCRPARIDICSTRHVRRLFSKPGESGLLVARDVSLDTAASSFESCHAEIVTCPSCAVVLTFTYLNLSCRCGSGLDPFSYGPCRSDHVRVTEPPYDDASGTSFCGVHPSSDVGPGRWEYKSKTRSVRVSLFYSRPHVHAFTMDYKSEPNRQILVGTSLHGTGANLSTGIISSPFFPAAYPRDIVVDYVLTCKRLPPSFSVDVDLHLEDDFNCRVHLAFTDFQLAAASFMEFYEGNRRVHFVSGTAFRPPVFVSSTNSLTARFLASGHSGVGFKAVFSFLSENVVKKMMTPATDCGGFVGNPGGTITMVNMVDSQMKLYYCIWLIQPRRNFLSVKSHLYLKVTAFFGFAGDAELQIRQGLTSESPLLESLRFPRARVSHEHVVPLKSGYYVSLWASFGPASHFALTYAGFSLDKCFGLSEFLCQNFRCISKKLTCDGFDHCGDNSDESGLCHRGGVFERGVAKWHTLTPNYYFPKIKEFSSSIVFFVSFASLVFLALAFAGFVYRTGRRARRQRSLRDQLRAISDLRDSISEEGSVEDVVIDDPPSYDPPPNYEDVIKVADLLGSSLRSFCAPSLPPLALRRSYSVSEFHKAVKLSR